MAVYPGLPDQRLVVNGVDLSVTYQMALLDGYTLEPPEPKTYTVDIPGGNGIIDLTEALAGDVVYENRNQEFEFAILYPDDYEKIKTKISNFLHGRSYDYTMTMDPGYTYHGRFTIESYEFESYAGDIVGRIKVKIEANPYKKKASMAYKLNATGGKLYRFESGRRKVHPTIECEQPCFVTWNGEETIVPAGTYRLNDVVFSQGFNELWVNTKRFFDITWDEIAEGGQFASTWDDLDGMRWDEIHMLGQSTADVVRSWDDLALTRWSDLAEKHWYDLNYIKNVVGDSTAYLTYEWEDL